MPDYAHLMRHPNRVDYEDAVLSVLEFPEELEILFGYFATGNTTDRNRSAWLLHHISDANPALFVPHHKKLLEYAPKAKTDAEKRFISRLFAKHGLPEDIELQGKLLNQTFSWISDSGESIAVKANCLSILHRFYKMRPEIKCELRAIIADQWPKSTAAFRSRAKYILQDLNPVKPE